MAHVDDGTLHELIDDALDTNDRAAVEAHLATCGECAKRFAEATAMARQVHMLLGALDAVPAPVRIVASTPARAAASTPVRNAALAAANVTPVQQQLRMIRRVALAASVLLVAGISYRAGVSRTKEDAQAARESATTVARLGAQPEAMQAVAESAPESAPKSVPESAPKSVPRSGPEAAPIAVPSAPTERVASRRAARAEDDVALGAAAPPVEAIAAQMAVPMAVPMAASAPVSRRAAADVASPAASMLEAMPRVGGSLAGYEMQADATLPAVNRRRYIAADGTMLMLTITPTTADESKRDANAVSEFTVSTAKGRNTVRWQRSGNSYELQGALPADSLMKLATQLK